MQQSPVAGNGDDNYYGGDGIPATATTIKAPTGVAVGSDGSIYIADSGHWRIRRVGPEGIITTVVGGAGLSNYWMDDAQVGDGGPATAALLTPLDVAIGPDGTLYIADNQGRRVRWVGNDGIIRTVAGSANPGQTVSGIDGPARAAKLAQVTAVSVGPDGNVYLVAGEVLQVNSPLPGYSASDIALPSEDGSEIYNFDGTGRHLRTLHALTGATLYEFRYDAQGRLVAIEDGDANITRIEREAGTGVPTAIIAPFSQRTELAINPNGYLDRVTNPANESYTMRYTDDGLLLSLTDPRQFEKTFTYDTEGRLIQDKDPLSTEGFLALARRNEGSDTYEVDLSTALGVTNTYRVETLPTGEQRRVNTFADGTQSEVLIGTDASRTLTYPTGMLQRYAEDPDPRFGMLAPRVKQETVSTPGGLAATWGTQRQVTLSNPQDPLSLTSMIDTLTFNGRSARSEYDAATRTFTVTTPENRSSTTGIDVLGRTVRRQVSGIAPATFAYDARGRIETFDFGTAANSRTTGLTYNTEGYLETVTDPAQRTTRFDYDAAGRVAQSTLPNSDAILFGHDANGNVTSITPPGRPAHGFTYDVRDLLERYTPPLVDNAGTLETVYAYNQDGQVTEVRRPDGKTIVYEYDAVGRLQNLRHPDGTISYAYDPDTGRLSSIGRSQGPVLGYTHDGALLTSVVWSGPVAGTVSMTYDDDLRLATRSVNGGPDVTYSYDNDGLRIQVGDMGITRDPGNGRITGTTLSNVTDSWAFNSFGEPIAYSAAYGGANLFNVTYVRDVLGRIEEKTETIEGVTHTYGYTYDLLGRLEVVRKDNVEIARYQYDANGNRRTLTTPTDTVNCTYDNQDRLLSCNNTTYAYTPNGELSSKIVAGTNTTTYEYDVFGALTRVGLPDGTVIEYLVDGENRRVGKRVNGTLVQRFLYKDQLNPIAELDGDGNLVSWFVFGTRTNVPDYMIRDGQTYRMISDHLGSPRLVVNTATGEVVQRLDYDEFGNLQVDTNPSFQPFGFAGGLYDRHTELVRFGMRDYDARIGRWTAHDPLLFYGTDANLYAYVNNDPVNLLDKTGSQAAPESYDPFSVSNTLNYIGAGATAIGIAAGAVSLALCVGTGPCTAALGAVGLITGAFSLTGFLGANWVHDLETRNFEESVKSKTELRMITEMMAPDGDVEFGPVWSIIIYPDGTIVPTDPASINCQVPRDYIDTRSRRLLESRRFLHDLILALRRP